MAPSYPYNHPVSQAIRGYNEWIYWALEGSNNTSTGHFHDHARGFSGIDARRKAIGAIGEGIFASRLASIPVYNSGLFIARSFGGYHHDLIRVTQLSRAGFGKFELNINYTDYVGNDMDYKLSLLREAPYYKAIVSYEIKTLNPKGEKQYILQGLSRGIDQLEERLQVADAAVLIFDLDAFNAIKNLPETQSLLRKMESMKDDSGDRIMFLRLEKDLYLESLRSYHAIKGRIENISPEF